MKSDKVYKETNLNYTDSLKNINHVLGIFIGAIVQSQEKLNP